jgi:type I restriction enzyme S subunit
MRSEWREAKLEELVTINRDSYSTGERWKYVNYLDTSNITKGVIDEIKYLDLDTTKLPSRARRKVSPNDIVYSTVRPNQEHYGIIENPASNMLVSTGFVTLTARENVEPYYLYYFMSQSHITKYLHAIAEQRVSTYPALNVSDIGNLMVAVPSLPIQRAIAETLSCLDAKIELNNKISENLEAQAQAIFKSWFVDFEPFQDGEFVESELGLIPEGWSVGKVGEYADLKSGFAFKSAWWVEEGVPVVRIGDIATNELRLEGAARIGRDNVPQDETYHLRAGDFLIAMTGATIAKTALVPAIGELLLLNQRVGKFIPLSKNGFPLPFLFCFIRDPATVDKIINLGSGSAQPNVSPSAIKSIPLILPPDKVLDDFNAICEPIFLKMLKVPIENKILSTVRNTLLPKLMSGEIEVPID